jgi:hypothetical protein
MSVFINVGIEFPICEAVSGQDGSGSRKMDLCFLNITDQLFV